MQTGPSLHPVSWDVRRMASEDSEQVGSGSLAIHRLRDLDDLGQSFERKMVTAVDQCHAQRKLLKVPLLRRMHGMSPEERDDRMDQIRSAAHHIAIQALRGCHS